MEYLTVKALSAKFAMPERTVYYYVANNLNIRVRKEWRSKLANVADFAKACGKEVQPSQKIANWISKGLPEWDIASLQKTLQQLQQEKSLETERMLSLQKVNTNLETNLNKFIQLHSEEKKEKMELMEKYDSLQNKYHLEVKKFLKRYYLALALWIVASMMLLLLNLSEIIETAQKIAK